MMFNINSYVHTICVIFPNVFAILSWNSLFFVRVCVSFQKIHWDGFYWQRQNCNMGLGKWNVFPRAISLQSANRSSNSNNWFYCVGLIKCQHVVIVESFFQNSKMKDENWPGNNSEHLKNAKPHPSQQPKHLSNALAPTQHPNNRLATKFVLKCMLL